MTDKHLVLVTRKTRLAELVTRFNTVSQARFYIEHLGAEFSDYLREDEAYHRALIETQTILARFGRLQTLDRSFLPNFMFAPDATVVALGQDGLVANSLKYLDGQPVVGVNPDPARWDGKLLPFSVGDLVRIIPETLAGGRPVKSITMARVILNNGQSLHAVNDIFIGPRTHTSARYLICHGQASETQSSSGVIISTGLGSSGWLKSLLTGATAVSRAAKALASGAISPKLPPPLPASPLHVSARKRKFVAASGSRSAEVASNGVAAKCEFDWAADHLFFTVREPFPTRTTGAAIVFGRVTAETPLILESQMAENGVIFSDGIEKDFLEFNSGTKATVNVAERKGVLVV